MAKNAWIIFGTMTFAIALSIFVYLNPLTISHASSSTSSSFQLDFGNIVIDANQKESGSFQLNDQITDIQNFGTSSGFQLMPALLTDVTSFDCGNGVKEIGEECDTSDFGGLACSDYGYNSGSLVCSALCVIDSSGCSTITTPPASGGGAPLGGSGARRIDDDEDEEEQEPASEPETEPEDQTEDQPESEIIEIPDSGQEEPTQPTQSQTQTSDSTSDATTEPTSPFSGEIAPKSAIPPKTTATTPQREKPQFHLESQPQTRKTTDKTPIITGQITPTTETQTKTGKQDGSYEIIIRDNTQNIILREKITLDENNVFIYEPPQDLPEGKYQFVIVDPDNNDREISSYSLEVIPKKHQNIFNLDFVDKKNVDTATEILIDLGMIIRTTEMFITGQAEPGSTIFAYFESNIQIVKTKTDQNGKFRLKIPSNLSLGEHKVRILQVFEDGLISDNIYYKFQLIPDKDSKQKKGNILYEILGTLITILLALEIYLIARYKKYKKWQK